MTNQFAVGIDLGTSTSEICIFSDGQATPVVDPKTKNPIIPSIAVVDPKGKFVIGKGAENRVDLPGQGVREIKRKMGTSETVEILGKKYRPEQISAEILRKLVDVAEEALQITIREVVLSVPANFDNAARQATLDAAEIAELKVLRLINEPTAAALAFGINNIDVEEQLAVFDFGGGTLDITILEMISGLLDVKCSYGDPKLGGKDFDEELTKLILKKFQSEHPKAQISEKSQRTLKGKAKEVKENLSEAFSGAVYLPNFAVENSEPIDLDIEVTREEFEQAIKPLLERAQNCLQQALDAKNLKSNEIDRILLVGGTTYIPAVRQLVTRFFGKEATTANVDPDLAVAIGASVQAGIQQGLVDEDTGIVMTDVSPFGLGIEVVDREEFDRTGEIVLKYDSLIAPNTTIPYAITRSDYSLQDDKQKEVIIRLYQDHTGKAQLPSEAIDTGIVGKIDDIPEAENGVAYAVEVRFTYNESGLVELKATLPKLGRSVEIQYERPAIFSASTMTAEEKAVAMQQSRKIAVENDKTDNFQKYINKANVMLPSLSTLEQNDLSKNVVNLEKAIASGNSKEIDKSGEKLIGMLFDLKGKG